MLEIEILTIIKDNRLKNIDLAFKSIDNKWEIGIGKYEDRYKLIVFEEDNLREIDTIGDIREFIDSHFKNNVFSYDNRQYTLTDFKINT